MTFRESTALHLKRLRRIQLISLFLIFGGFVLTIAGWTVIESELWYGKIIMVIGIVGEFYCWAKTRQIKCPQCGKSLSYLLLDPSYSKTNGVILLPRGLPPDRHCCAYRKASFDDEIEL